VAAGVHPDPRAAGTAPTAPRASAGPAPRATPGPSATAASPAGRRPEVEAAGPASGDERAEIWSLLDGGRLNLAAVRIAQLVARDPDGAWPRFALGALYMRRSWRPDSLAQWQVALARDPSLARDPQFGASLCFMVDRKWQEAGVTDLLDRLGDQAPPLLQACAASARTPALRAAAQRLLDRPRAPERRGRRPR
jgi:hypothetical protein